MKNINKNIQEDKFERVYLLYGEEDYLKRMYKHKLMQAIAGDDSMNSSYYEGKDLDISDVRDTSQTLPFFAERRLIVIEDSQLFKTSADAMVDIVKNAPETTIFVFCESDVDKRNKLYKTVNDIGYVCELKQQTEDALITWTLRFFTEADKKITRSDMQLFLQRTGSDMDNISNEAAKLIAYTGDRQVVTAQDIDAVCTVQIVDRIFDMINAIASKKKDEAIRLYGDLLALKEPPMKILALLARQFIILMGVREMIDAGHSNQAITQKLGLRPFFTGRYVAQAKCFTQKQLKAAVEDCAKAETGVKTGNAEDTYAVELLIIKYSM